MPVFERDGLVFHYLDKGDPTGRPFVFQHGLGAMSPNPPASSRSRRRKRRRGDGGSGLALVGGPRGGERGPRSLIGSDARLAKRYSPGSLGAAFPALKA